MAAIPTDVSKDKQQSFGWDAFNHATYFPDLTPSDFHAFCDLRGVFGGQWFHDEENLEKLRLIFSKRKTWHCMPQASTNSTDMKNSSLRMVIM